MGLPWGIKLSANILSFSNLTGEIPSGGDLNVYYHNFFPLDISTGI